MQLQNFTMVLAILKPSIADHEQRLKDNTKASLAWWPHNPSMVSFNPHTPIYSKRRVYLPAGLIHSQTHALKQGRRQLLKVLPGQDGFHPLAVRASHRQL